MEVVAEMRFDLPRTYQFHKRDCVDVQVDLLRVYWEDSEGGKPPNVATRADEEEVINDGHNDEEKGRENDEENAEKQH